MLSITWLAKLKMKNDLRIEFAPLFNKQRKAAPLEIKKAFQDTLALFIVEPDPVLSHMKNPVKRQVVETF